jgi:hypothetical protein
LGLRCSRNIEPASFLGLVVNAYIDKW